MRHTPEVRTIQGGTTYASETGSYRVPLCTSGFQSGASVELKELPSGIDDAEERYGDKGKANISGNEFPSAVRIARIRPRSLSLLQGPSLHAFCTGTPQASFISSGLDGH